MNRIKQLPSAIWNRIKTFFGLLWVKIVGAGVLNSFFAILCGLLMGFIIMFLVRPGKSLDGLERLLFGAFNLGSKGIGNILFNAAPLILVGLSVAFAFKTGLFNIGGSGQFMIGGIAALYAAHLLTLPAPFHFVVCLLAGIAAGGIWGAIPGFLKAFFNVSEVIATIMLNYVGMYLSTMLAANTLVYDSGITAVGTQFPTANIPTLGFNKLFKGSNLDMSLLIAVLVAILIMVILNRTTLGFQLKAVGHSVNGSKYAGINYRRNVIISMTIAGALSGLGAALAYLPIKPDYFSTATKIVDYGFDGISVSLMAQNNPIGIIFSGIFTSYIRAGAKSMQFAGYDLQIANVVISVIIYMIAISNFISIMVKKYKTRIQENEKGDENV